MLGVIIWYSYPRPVPVGINLVGSDTGTVTLALTPSSISLTPNIEATLTLSINAGTSHATAAQIELTYDAAKIGTPTITQGDFFTSSISSTTVENGKINFTYVAPTDSGGITGSGTLATIKIKPPIVGTSSLPFTENTLVTTTEN